MPDANPRPKLPPAIWALGLVSLCMDLSSELIHALLPLLLVTELGASVAVLGVIEGVAEATAAFAKLGSGALSDRLSRRKPLVLLGYGMAALTKPLFPLASGAGLVFLARFLDRIGKGIRGAPRDALIGDLVDPAQRGAAFGLRQSLDTIGAIFGPLAAMVAIGWFAFDLRQAMWLAVVPAFAAVLLLWLGVPEPAAPITARPSGAVRRTFGFDRLRLLDRHYWLVVVIAVTFTLARYSDAFLLLAAGQHGLSMAVTPLVLVVMNVVYTASAYPAGLLADRVGRSVLLPFGLGLLILANLALAAFQSSVGLWVGVALWGLHMGLTQGVFAALVADAAPAELRGLAFGVYHATTGVSVLLASLFAGLLWDAFGGSATFLSGAGFAALALVAVVLNRRTALAPRG